MSVIGYMRVGTIAQAVSGGSLGLGRVHELPRRGPHAPGGRKGPPGGWENGRQGKTVAEITRATGLHRETVNRALRRAA